MYYIHIDGLNADKLVYQCHNCGNEDKYLVNENISVSKTQIKKTEQTFHNIVNPYTKLDPTLPRVNNILCPNANCDTNTKNKPREIIRMRYDDTNMKYLNLCSECDTVWK
jgi:DNA-directed RNA polymerase subunit M/transcription elongation factor TFIIS